MLRPQPRWIARWAAGVALVGLIAAATRPQPDEPLSVTSVDVDRPTALHLADSPTTDTVDTDDVADEPSTTSSDPDRPTTSTTRRTGGTSPASTATTVFDGVEQPGEEYGIGVPVPEPGAPTITTPPPTYPRTWQTPVGAAMPVISCGTGSTMWRCLPAVWPPPELAADPCPAPSMWNPPAPALSKGFDGAVRTDQPTADGYAPGDNYVVLRWTGNNDCLWHQFEGIRFIQVEWYGPSVGRVSATIDWGDGTRTPANPRRPGCEPSDSWGTSAYEYGHKYAAAGTYTATITVTGGRCQGTEPDSPMTDVETLVFTLTSPVYERYVIK